MKPTFLPVSARPQDSVNINVSFYILLSLSLNLMLDNFVIIEIGTYPICPNNMTIGAFLPTPRKLNSH